MKFELRRSIYINKITKIIIISILSSILAFGALSVVFGRQENVAIPAKADKLQQDEIVQLINQERLKNNLLPLKINLELSNSAKSKAEDMSKKKYFSHTSPTGKKWSDFIQSSGYDYAIAGENLARNYVTPESAVKAWLESPSHRDNILNSKLEETGIGIIDTTQNKTRNIYIVQHFGKK
jgi:uncharacterized protein YkwD